MVPKRSEQDIDNNEASTQQSLSLTFALDDKEEKRLNELN